MSSMESNNLQQNRATGQKIFEERESIEEIDVDGMFIDNNRRCSEKFSGFNQSNNNNNKISHNNSFRTRMGASKRCINVTLRVIFSTPGLVILVICYSIFGAVIFQLLEAPPELENSVSISKSREECLKELWTITERLNVLYERNWTLLVHEQLRRFEGTIVAATKGGLFGEQLATSINGFGEQVPQWTFSEALLYSITVITTIGHGNLTPRTNEGKIMTMLYAVVGVPLMLMCLSSLGGLLADALQCAYGKLCPTSVITSSKSCHIINEEECDNTQMHRHINNTKHNNRCGCGNDRLHNNCNHINNIDEMDDCKYDLVQRQQQQQQQQQQSHQLQNTHNHHHHHHNHNQQQQQLQQLHHQQQQQQQHQQQHDERKIKSYDKYRGTMQEDSCHLIHSSPSKSLQSTPHSSPCHQLKNPNTTTLTVYTGVSGQPSVTMTTGGSGKSSPSHQAHFNHIQQQQQQGILPPVVYYPTLGPNGGGLIQYHHLKTGYHIPSDHSLVNNPAGILHTATVHGLGRSKYMPKPLPQEINILLAECDISGGNIGCHQDTTQTTILSTATTATATAPVTQSLPVNVITASMPTATSLVATMTTTTKCAKMEQSSFEEDDDDDNRIGCPHGTPSRIPLIPTSKSQHMQLSRRKQQNRHRNDSDVEEDTCGRTDHGDDDEDGDDAEEDDSESCNTPQVPITIIFLILISYICLGTVIFSLWENWSIVDGAYFCFVTLSTIGFGDLVPKRTFRGPELQLFACCAYLMLGLVLVAMSFSLVESQLMWKCRRMAVRLKLAKD